MPISKLSSLKKLISSLTKAEKRHFVLFVRRLDSNKAALYIKLFQAMDASPKKEDSYYYKKIEAKNSSQYLNAKRHLYSQVLKGLRLFHEANGTQFRLRQKLDYAGLLYRKGLFYESLAILNSIAKNSSAINNLLYLEIAELKKKIESRHITRSRKNKNRIEHLISDTEKLQQLVTREVKMVNISLEIQGLYIKWGFAKDERDALMYQVYFNSQMPEFNFVIPSILAMVLWHQSFVWYHYMTLNFHFSYKHAVRWVLKMESDDTIIKEDPDLFFRGFHYILTCCFYLDRKDRFMYWFEKYKAYRNKIEDTLGTSALLDFWYYNNAELNSMIIQNKYPRLSVYSTSLETSMNSFIGMIDVHRMMMFYYKLSLIHNYRGEYERAIDYLNIILENQDKQLRSDLLSYSRLIHLLTHYRINNFKLVLNLLPSVRAAFESNNRMNNVLEVIISFLRRGSKAVNFGINEMIDTSIDKLMVQRQSRFNKVSFLYFDFISWMFSVKSGLTVEKIRKEKA